jgi:hypothetical protein
MRSQREMAAVGPGPCLGDEVLPGFFVELPVEKGKATAPVVIEDSEASIDRQAVGDGSGVPLNALVRWW